MVLCQLSGLRSQQKEPGWAGRVIWDLGNLGFPSRLLKWFSVRLWALAAHWSNCCKTHVLWVWQGMAEPSYCALPIWCTGPMSGSDHINPCVQVSIWRILKVPASLFMSEWSGSYYKKRLGRQIRPHAIPGSISGRGLRPSSYPWGDLCYLSHPNSLSVISAASCFKWLVIWWLALTVINRNSAEEEALTVCIHYLNWARQ